MKLKSILLMIIAAFVMVACNDDDDISTSSVSVTMELPTALKDKAANVSNIVVTFENVNTGAVIKHQSNKLSLSNLIIEDGLYTIKVEGNVSYETSYKKKIINDDLSEEEQEIKETITNKLKGYGENVEVKGGKLSIPITLFIYNEKAGNGFVISEVFFTRTSTPEGKSYDGDTFIEIYNNSNEILYADGLCVGETTLQTNDLQNKMTPDFRMTKVAVKDVYRIPGSGKEHPVKPGEVLLLADIAINHKTNNPNSFDLSKANFEWFDEDADDVDVPEVMNLEKMISTNGGAWNLNSRGQNAIVLFRLADGTTPESFLNDNALDYSFTYNFPGGSFESTESTWAIENDKVVDAVQLSVLGEFQWNVIAPELDLSWTYGTETEGYNGLSVRRKISHKEGARIVLQDTNNSAFDFIPTALPSPGMVEEK